MKNLDCFTSDCIKLLNKYNLLQPLVRADLITSILSVVPISESEEELLINDFSKQNSLHDDQIFQDWLNNNKFTRESLLEQLSQKLRLSKHCNENYSLKAEAHFLKRKLQLDQVVYSLIRLRDPFHAREIYLRIADGEADFGNLALELSEGKEKLTRGIVGPVPLTQAHPQLVQLLKNRRVGELQEPIHIEGWNLIVRLESYQAAILDEAMEQQMSQELFGLWVDDEVGRTMKRLMAELTSAELRPNFSEPHE